MNRKSKSKSAKKTLSRKELKSAKGGALNSYISTVQGEKQGIAIFKEVSGLKSEESTLD